jgi:hypothetical protein
LVRTDFLKGISILTFVGASAAETAVEAISRTQAVRTAAKAFSIRIMMRRFNK